MAAAAAAFLGVPALDRKAERSHPERAATPWPVHRAAEVEALRPAAMWGWQVCGSPLGRVDQGRYSLNRPAARSNKFGLA